MPQSPWRRIGQGWLAGILLSGCLALPVHGQAVQGVVARADSDERLAGALIDLVAVAPEANDIEEIETDADGAFVIRATAAGNYVLRVRLLGYKPQFAILALEAGQTVALRVNLAPMVVSLDAITVYGLEAATPGQKEFWSRRDLDWGFSFDHTQFEEMGAHTIAEVIQFGIPGGRLPYCAIVYRDGWKIGTYQMANFPLGWVYGIEIYRTKFDIPIRYRDPFENPRCGAVLIWTHEVGKGRK